MAFPQEIADADFPQQTYRTLLENCERGDEYSNFLFREGSGSLVRRGPLRKTCCS